MEAPGRRVGEVDAQVRSHDLERRWLTQSRSLTQTRGEVRDLAQGCAA